MGGIDMLWRIVLFSAAGLAAISAPVNGQPTPLPPIASLSGKVLLPDGEPAVDAPVVVAVWQELVAQTRTNANGEFSFAKIGGKDAALQNEAGWRAASVAAGATGFGPAWRMLRTIAADERLVLPLVEDLPIVGRILDQQGNPLVGASCTLDRLSASPKGVEGFLKTNRDNPFELWLHERDQMQSLSPRIVRMLQGSPDAKDFSVRSDAQGRVSVSGFGRGRVVRCRVSGPKFVSDLFYVVTIPQIDPKWKRRPFSAVSRNFMEGGATLLAVYPASFHLIVRPARTLTGTVVDASDGRPVAGMAVSAGVRGAIGGNQATTGSDGRYSVGGLPLEGELRVSVLNPGGKPYLDAVRTTTLSVDRPDVSMDFRIARGVIASGRVRDEAGRPVRGWVSYLTWPNNPVLAGLPERFESFNQFQTDVEGRFNIAIPSGPGVLTFSAAEPHFVKAKDADFGFPLSANGPANMFQSGNAGLVFAQIYHAIKRIEPPADAEKLEVDFVLRPSRTLTIRVVGSDGKNIAERVSVSGASEGPFSAATCESTFPATGFQPGQTRTLFICDEKKQSALVANVTCPSEPDSSQIAVRLQPTGEVSGRLLDAEGRPCSKWYVVAGSTGAGERFLAPGKQARRTFDFGNTACDVDGYFRIVGIPSRTDFDLVAVPVDRPGAAQRIATGLSIQPRERHDLGGVALKKGK
jgi:hypothetical protein